MSHTSVSAIIQARMGSTRLPGKVLKPILGKPLLFYVTERLKKAKTLSDIIVATTTLEQDNVIETFCKESGIPCFRGDSEDVLSRYIHAMRFFGTDIAVRITADCPLVDPEIVDQAALKFLEGSFDYVGNTINRTYPRGMDVEVFSYEALERAYVESTTKAEREHVTHYILTHQTLFNIFSLEEKENLSAFRLTVDTPEDFLLVAKIIESFKTPHFSLQEIMTLLSRHPEWLAINAHIQQKAV